MARMMPDFQNEMRAWLTNVVTDAVDAALIRAGLTRAPSSGGAASDGGRAVFTVGELATRWRKSRSYIRLLIAQGKLEHRRFGNRLIITVEVVDRHERDGIPSTGDGTRKARRDGVPPVLPLRGPGGAE